MLQNHRIQLPTQPPHKNKTLSTFSLFVILSDASVPYKLPAVSTCFAYDESAYAWKQQRTNAFAATSLLQINAWHSNTLMPVVRLKMAAKSGGCAGFGARANGESNGRKRGLGVWRVFFSGTRTYLKHTKKENHEGGVDLHDGRMRFSKPGTTKYNSLIIHGFHIRRLRACNNCFQKA